MILVFEPSFCTWLILIARIYNFSFLFTFLSRHSRQTRCCFLLELSLRPPLQCAEMWATRSSTLWEYPVSLPCHEASFTKRSLREMPALTAKTDVSATPPMSV
ncbi:Glyceraldehyde-3-phosphate dehydrogenase (phosphorylating), partial [Trypanosoma cruzi]